MRAGRRGDRLWLRLWCRDEFWHQLPKMRRTDDDVISLHAIRLTAEALSGLLRTARHLVVNADLQASKRFQFFTGSCDFYEAHVKICAF